MKPRPKPMAYLVLRRDYPTGYRIPYGVCLNRDRAIILASNYAAEFGRVNPTLRFDVCNGRFRFLDDKGRAVVFCVETLPLLE